MEPPLDLPFVEVVADLGAGGCTDSLFVLVLSGVGDGSSSICGDSRVMLGGVYFGLEGNESLFLRVAGGVLFLSTEGILVDPEPIRLVGGMAGVAVRGIGAVS